MPRTALLILDAINPFDFDGAQDIADAAVEASAVIARLRDEADALSLPAIYVNDNYGHWDSEKAQIVRDAAKGSKTAEAIIGRLAPRPADYFVIKPHFSGFYATNLTALLDRLEIERLVLTGYAADICVLFTAGDAHMRGYDLWIPADATASESADRRRWALQIMAKSMDARTEATGELDLSAWADGRPAPREPSRRDAD
jgi:nicotinamidase-related amidase